MYMYDHIMNHVYIYSLAAHQLSTDTYILQNCHSNQRRTVKWVDIMYIYLCYINQTNVTLEIGPNL